MAATVPVSTGPLLLLLLLALVHAQQDTPPDGVQAQSANKVKLITVKDCKSPPCSFNPSSGPPVSRGGHAPKTAENYGYMPELPTLQHWHDPDVEMNNNCFNFATNRVTNTFAQPGAASGNLYRSLSCSEVIKGAVSDGLVKVNKAEVGVYANGTRNCHYVALVVAKDYDFHWYRLMRTDAVPNVKGKVWWHKPGSWPVKTVDWSGKAISDVEASDRGPYTRFCGYFRYCLNIM